MNVSRSVELRMAWEWTCDNCGRDSYCRAVVIAPEALDPVSRADLAEACGGYDPEAGDFITRPARVACPHCGARFDVVGPEDDE